MLADVLFRLRALLRPGTVERELDDELRGHLDRATDKYVEAGMSRSDAVRRARLELGGVAQVKEQCRDARGTRGIEEIIRDLRYAVRMLRAQPRLHHHGRRVPRARHRRQHRDLHAHRRGDAAPAAGAVAG